MAYTPTDEQQAIIDAFTTGDDVVIQAGAGTGKTSTLKFLAGARPNQRGIYIAFNKSIQKDAEASFPRSVRCRTAHSFAFRWMSDQWGRQALLDRLNGPRLPTMQTARILGLDKPLMPAEGRMIQPAQQSRIASETVARFCRSADTQPEKWHVPQVNGTEDPEARAVLVEAILPAARAAWADLTRPDGKLRFQHDHYLAQWAISEPLIDCDYIMLDEGQDCQPPGTEVLVVSDARRPGRGGGQEVETAKIEDLHVGDRVVSYTGSSLRLRMRGSRVTSISSHQHDGELVRITTDNGLSSRYTPGHICLARIGPAVVGKTLLYLMRRGDAWRVGVTAAYHGRLKLDRPQPTASMSSGIAGRLREEQGDAIWLLAAYDDKRDALMAEAATSARYGIPEMRFRDNGTRNIGQERLDAFWEGMGDLTPKAEVCLAAFGRDIRYPLATRSFTEAGTRNAYLLYTRSATVRACNLMDGMHVLDSRPLSGRRSQAAKRVDPEVWRPITVTREPYAGPVWSIEVENDHTYVGDGIVTHNCDPRIASVFDRQRHAQRVAVGDQNQAIYGWRGATDYLSKIDAPHHLYLSQSFRFGQAVADEANKWLTLLDAELRIRGNPDLASTLAPLHSPDAVLCRSNAEAVNRLMRYHGQHIPAAIVGGGDDIARLAKAAIELKEKGQTWHPELVAFPSWSLVQEYVEQSADGSDLKVAVNLIDEHGPEAIIDAIERAIPENRAQVVLSTAHKAKGREWPRVQIADDFRPPKEDEYGEKPPPSREDSMLAYVAVTRARQVLDPSGLEWVNEYIGGAQ